MEIIKWAFEGIGTQIVGLIIGALIGGTAGYKIGIHKNQKLIQKQKAGHHSNQVQVGANNG